MIRAEMPDDPTPGSGVSKIAKMPLEYLPKGILIGDTVQLVVENIDSKEGTATLMVPEGLNKGEGAPETDDAKDPTAAGEEAPGGNDSSVLLGPMNGLKNYLVKKSQDTSNSGTY